ncbi:helix-turn-helix transcriptional regulator [Singulisphaera rosea]
MHQATRPPLARMMAIDQALRAGTWPNASTLARQLEVNPRTIRRDLTYLRDQLGAPLEFDPVRNGYCYAEPSFRLPFFQLSEGELFSLLLAERLLRQYHGTPFEADLRRAFERITNLLPNAISVRLDSLADCLSVMPTVRISYDPQVFDTLARAVVCRRRVEMDYWTAGRNVTSSRDFDPYHLALIDDGWYAIGHCHVRNEVRMFAVQRVRSVVESNTTFDLPADFRVEDYMAASFRAIRGEGQHHVAVRFPPEFAGRLAERVWHPSQTNEPTPDGGLILRFEVSDLREIKRWVMFWGVDCEVIEPEELRDALKGEILEIVRTLC